MRDALRRGKATAGIPPRQRSAPDADTISVVTRSPARRPAVLSPVTAATSAGALLTGLEAGHALAVGWLGAVLWFLVFCAAFSLVYAGDAALRRRHR